jgi:DNA-binding transcriptional LysR family regulator
MKDFDGAMRLNQLKMLVAVADHGSFGAAAAALDCTQSRISHAIAELERDLGVRLLTRERTGSTPTDTGHRVLEKARQMLRLEGSLFEVAREGCGLAGQVRIACFQSVGTHLLPFAVEALAHEYPNLRVDIDDSCDERNDVTDALAGGRADIGIAQLPVDDRFATQPWLRDDYVLVVPAGLDLGANGTWPRHGALPFIELGCTGAVAILQRCRDAGYNVEPGRTLANHASVVAMVARGIGFSILPRLLTWPAPDEVRCLPLPIAARREFAIAGLPPTMRSPAVRAVVRFLRDKRIVARTRAYQAGVVGW